MTAITVETALEKNEGEYYDCESGRSLLKSAVSAPNSLARRSAPTMLGRTRISLSRRGRSVKLTSLPPARMHFRSSQRFTVGLDTGETKCRRRR